MWLHKSAPFLLLASRAVAILEDDCDVPTITWSTCPSSIPPGVECGTVNVPLAYKPSTRLAADVKETVTLGLTRLNATSQARKQGALFVNPGGPGVSAAWIVAVGAFAPPELGIGFTTEIRDAYDIIGLDPRGVGISTPVQCDPEIYNERVATFVNDTAGYDALVDYNRRLGESCANLTGPLLDHLDTLHVAKDHELVRRALGEPKLNLLGISYGSMIGSQYASLFPESVGRMAFDGIVDHSQSEASALLTEATTYEVTLDKFFSWCHDNSTCALHGKDVSRVFDDVVALADASPIPAPGCNGSCQPNVTGEDIRYNVQNFLIFVDAPLGQNWISLGQALAEASEGNATSLSTSIQTSKVAAAQLESPYLYLATGCQDWKHSSRNATDLSLKLQMAKTFAPRTRGASQTYTYQSKCIGWPAPVSNPQAPLDRRVSKAPPILLVNSVYDPACSLVWAQGLREQLPGAVSVTRNGAGHTSYFLGGETRKVMDRYLATGEFPEDGTVLQT